MQGKVHVQHTLKHTGVYIYNVRYCVAALLIVLLTHRYRLFRVPALFSTGAELLFRHRIPIVIRVV